MKEIKRIVVFGDSLLDGGNLIKTLDIPQEPYYKGRFSNGPVSTEYLAEHISEMQDGAEIKSKNYATGGALTYGKNPSSLLKEHSIAVSDQVSRFENEEGRFSKDDLIIINGGSNNFMFMIYNEIPYINLTAKLRVARDLYRIVKRIIKLGGQNIVVWNLPDITRAPAYKDYFSNWVGKFFRSYMQMNINLQNGLLTTRVKDLQILFPNVNLKMFDFYELLNDCSNNPQKYGFESADNICVDSYGGADSQGNIQYDIPIIADPEKHLCWDYCHPTTKAHKLVAEKILDIL